MLESILIPKVYVPIICLLIAYIFYKFLSKLVDKVLKIKEKGKSNSTIQNKREKTNLKFFSFIIV